VQEVVARGRREHGRHGAPGGRRVQPQTDERERAPGAGAARARQQLAHRVAQPAAPFGRRPVGASSTNGRRIHVSTFSWTTSFDSVNVAAASAGSSAFESGARPRAEAAVPASAGRRSC